MLRHITTRRVLVLLVGLAAVPLVLVLGKWVHEPPPGDKAPAGAAIDVPGGGGTAFTWSDSDGKPTGGTASFPANRPDR